jgi:hypothetical protein
VLLPQLHRVRWAVRATLILGVAASVVANILHALDNPISQAIAAWPPLALLLTVELISRVPVHRRSLAFARLVATAAIAGIAAWVSYWHMAGVAARYGETGASPYLLPLSVDGLIVVASICLVELGGRISALQSEAAATAKATHLQREAAATTKATRLQDETAATVKAVGLQGETAATTKTARLAAAAPRAAVSDDSVAAAGRVSGAADGHDSGGSVPGLIPVPSTAPGRRSPTTAAALAEVAAALPRTGLPKTRGAEVSAFAPTLTRQGRATASAKSTTSAAARTNASATRTTVAVRTGPATAKPGGPAKNAAQPTAKPRRTPAETLAAAAKIKAAKPHLTDAELAAELGISTSRWRTIRRQADQGDLHLAA